MRSSKRWPDTPPLYPDGLARAASEAGGVLIRVKIPAMPPPQNGGCGAQTHVAGTNGGTLPCGSMLTMLGTTNPYYCAVCSYRMSVKS